MRAAVQRPIILLKPVLPWRHQGLGFAATLIQQMEHAAGAATAGATLGVTADRPLLIQKADRLLQHRFRKPQLGMGVTEVVHQGGGIAVSVEQALQDPAHGQLQPEVLNRRLSKEGPDGLQTGGA
jgi:hypothetical protein